MEAPTKVQPSALKRVKEATITGERLAQLFEMLAEETTMAGGVSNSFTIDYQDDNEAVSEPAFIPQIVLVLRPIQ